MKQITSCIGFLAGLWKWLWRLWNRHVYEVHSQSFLPSPPTRHHLFLRSINNASSSDKDGTRTHGAFAFSYFVCSSATLSAASRCHQSKADLVTFSKDASTLTTTECKTWGRWLTRQSTQWHLFLDNDNFDGEGFSNYLGPYALALVVSLAVTAGFVKFVLMDYWGRKEMTNRNVECQGECAASRLSIIVPIMPDETEILSPRLKIQHWYSGHSLLIWGTCMHYITLLLLVKWRPARTGTIVSSPSIPNPKTTLTPRHGVTIYAAGCISRLLHPQLNV